MFLFGTGRFKYIHENYLTGTRATLLVWLVFKAGSKFNYVHASVQGSQLWLSYSWTRQHNIAYSSKTTNAGFSIHPTPNKSANSYTYILKYRFLYNTIFLIMTAGPITKSFLSTFRDPLWLTVISCDWDMGKWLYQCSVRCNFSSMPYLHRQFSSPTIRLMALSSNLVYLYNVVFNTCPKLQSLWHFL